MVRVLSIGIVALSSFFWMTSAMAKFYIINNTDTVLYVYVSADEFIKPDCKGRIKVNAIKTCSTSSGGYITTLQVYNRYPEYTYTSWKGNCPYKISHGKLTITGEIQNRNYKCQYEK